MYRSVGMDTELVMLSNGVGAVWETILLMMGRLLIQGKDVRSDSLVLVPPTQQQASGQPHPFRPDALSE